MEDEAFELNRDADFERDQWAREEAKAWADENVGTHDVPCSIAHPHGEFGDGTGHVPECIGYR